MTKNQAIFSVFFVLCILNGDGFIKAAYSADAAPKPASSPYFFYTSEDPTEFFNKLHQKKTPTPTPSPSPTPSPPPSPNEESTSEEEET